MLLLTRGSQLSRVNVTPSDVKLELTNSQNIAIRFFSPRFGSFYLKSKTFSVTIFPQASNHSGVKDNLVLAIGLQITPHAFLSLSLILIDIKGHYFLLIRYPTGYFIKLFTLLSCLIER